MCKQFRNTATRIRGVISRGLCLNLRKLGARIDQGKQRKGAIADKSRLRLKPLGNETIFFYRHGEMLVAVLCPFTYQLELETTVIS